MEMEINNKQPPSGGLPVMRTGPQVTKSGLGGDVENTEESITYDIFEQNYKNFKRNKGITGLNATEAPLSNRNSLEKDFALM